MRSAWVRPFSRILCSNFTSSALLLCKLPVMAIKALLAVALVLSFTCTALAYDRTDDFKEGISCVFAVGPFGELKLDIHAGIVIKTALTIWP